MISVIINAYNAEKYIREVLDAILKQTVLPHEMIIVNDGSTDNTLKILREYPKRLKGELKNAFKLVEKYKVINQSNQGIAAAANRAIKEAKGKFIVSVEADAVIESRFIERAVKELQDDETIGAVGGYIKTANKKKFWARMMGYDLEYRYDHIGGLKEKRVFVDHISPNNTAYRKEVFKKIGYFDPSYNYCQDVDFSYRMKEKGFKMLLLKDVGCKHYWKETFAGFTKQQFNVSYGRIKFLRKHPRKGTGDKVADFRMFMQIPLTGLIILSAIITIFIPVIWSIPTILLVLLLGERSLEACYLVKKKKSVSMLLLPFVHIWRNIVWNYSLIHYLFKR